MQRIAVWHKRGLTPEEIRDRVALRMQHRFGRLNLAQVHAALTYYYANRDEIEEYLAWRKKPTIIVLKLNIKQVSYNEFFFIFKQKCYGYNKLFF